jgi:hypothetical protein
MNIQVTKGKTTEEVQAEFCAAFPFLRLAFFDHSQQAGPFPFTVQYGGRMPGRPDDRLQAEAVSNIEERMSVGEVEELLHSTMGLCVRVLRRSGDRWQDAAITGHLTLGEQNAQARAGLRTAAG